MREDLFDRRRRVRRRSANQVELFLLGGVIDEDIEHEPVELRFGQRVGSFLLDRVLRRQHEERVGKPVAFAARRHLVLLHGFQQGRLGFGGVRLISSASTTLAKTGPPIKRNSRAARRAVLLNHVRSRNVGGHQVGRELDAVEREVEGVGQRPHHQGLGEAGHPLQQAVAAGKHADQKLLDHPPLTDDDLAELVGDFPVRLVEPLDRFLIGRSRRRFEFAVHAGLSLQSEEAVSPHSLRSIRAALAHAKRPKSPLTRPGHKRREQTSRHADVNHVNLAREFGGSGRVEALFSRDESRRLSGPHADPQRQARVAIEAGRKIDGEHADTRVVDVMDHRGGRLADGTLHARPQKGIDDPIGGRQFGGPRIEPGRRVIFEDRRAGRPQDMEVGRRVPLERLRIGEKQNAHVDAADFQVAGDDKTVAPVVAASRENDHLPPDAKGLEQSAAPRPAFSISTIPGMPNSSIARRSISRTSARLNGRSALAMPPG